MPGLVQAARLIQMDLWRGVTSSVGRIEKEAAVVSRPLLGFLNEGDLGRIELVRVGMR